MADLAREKGRTERYLPKAAWAQLSPEERRATDERKKRATAGNKPVNTQVPVCALKHFNYGALSHAYRVSNQHRFAKRYHSNACAIS